MLFRAGGRGKQKMGEAGGKILRGAGENTPNFVGALRSRTVAQTGSLLYRGLAIRNP
jgi:hypothetical protein